MGKADHLVLGDHNAVCYECGRKFKASMLKRHWKGYYVCPQHWEPREQQDFVRAVPDVQTPSWVQAQPADVFLSGGEGFVTEDSDTFHGDFIYFFTEDGELLVTEA